jgi:D-sedoheptulose 7-phosphate isomerase
MPVDFNVIWKAETAQHMKIAAETFDSLSFLVGEWVDLAEKTVRSGGKVMFCGNGGSAADAQHIAAELSVKLCQDRLPIAAICLSLDPSAMTACGNDYGYEHIFSRQVQALGKAGDLLVGFTTSGNSNNVLKAIEIAQKNGIKSVVLTGASGGKAAPMADVAIKVPCSDSTARIQEMHITMGHIFCMVLEQRLGLV